MNAVPPSFTVDAQSAATRWHTLAGAATVVAALAGAEASADEIDGEQFAGLVEAAQGWRRVQAENGVADIAAFMEPGIAALLAVHARGVDARPAAAALWSEYRAARAAVLALLHHT